MRKNDAASRLIYLLNKYHRNESKKNILIAAINDAGRPGLPVRGCLEDLRPYVKQDFSDADKLLIEDLLYYYG